MMTHSEIINKYFCVNEKNNNYYVLCFRHGASMRGTVMKEIDTNTALLSKSLQFTRNMCINLLITRVMAVIKGEYDMPGKHITEEPNVQGHTIILPCIGDWRHRMAK